MSRFKIIRQRIEPEPIKKELVLERPKYIRAREVGDEGHFKWAVEADLIINLKIVERDIKTVFSKQYPDGYELVRAEYDIIDPKCEWSQKFHKREINPGDEGYEETGSYDNEFEIIYPSTLDNLENLNMEAIKEHLQTYYQDEFRAALGEFVKFEKTERR